MPTINNSRDELLNLFPDNNQQLIEAQDIRAFVNAIYDEAVIKGEDVIDNLVTISSTLPLSAQQGYILNTSKEPVFGNPPIDGYVLRSYRNGTRYWDEPISRLGQLIDVSDDIPVNGDYLIYDSSLKEWIPKKPFSLMSYLEKGGREWNSKYSYKKGDIVTEKNLIYVALVDSYGTPPNSYPGSWELVKDIESLNDLIDVELQFGQINDGDYLRANYQGIFSNSNFDLDVLYVMYQKITEGTGIDVTVENTNVKISLNAELDELNNVYAPNPNNRDILVYDTGTRKWISTDIIDRVDRGGQEWVSDFNYQKGAIVTRYNKTFSAQFPNIGEDPLTSSNWKIHSLENQPDVLINQLENGDVLLYDSFGLKWVNTGTTFEGGTQEQKYKIPRLDENGKLDSNMIEVTMFHRIDSWDPSFGEEYPDTSNETPGAFWDIVFYDGTTLEYTFNTGDLVGKTVKAGDFIIWGLGGWTIMPAVMNPLEYYRRDGSQPITSNFEAGGFKLINVAQGTDLNDGVTYRQLQTKENYLDVPDFNDYVLASDVNGNRYWVENTGGIQVVEWGDIQGTLSQQTDLQDALDLKSDKTEVFLQTQFQDESDGTAGKPIVTSSNGKIHNSFISIESLHYVGTWTPQSGNEYPDISNETPGAFWIVQGLVIDYTFMTGELIGQSVSNGDYMMYGTNGWDIINSTIDPNIYYRLDGTKEIEAPFAGGNQQIKNIAQGTENSDAITLFQHNQHKTDVNNPHVVTKTQIGLGDVQNLAPEDMPISDDTQSALDSKENWLKNPTIDGMVLSSSASGQRSWINIDTKIDWGDIGGTLNNQTDLWDQLESKVKKSGDSMTGQLTVQNRIQANELLVMSSNNISSVIFDNTNVGNDTKLMWSSSEEEFQVQLNDGSTYKILHEGNVNPDEYLKKSGGLMTGPLYMHEYIPTSNLEATTKYYVDQEVAKIPTNVMTTDVYDSDNTGIVDDSEKLGGYTPDWYATDVDLAERVSIHGDTMDGKLIIQDDLESQEVFTNKLTVGLNPSLGNDSRIVFTDQNIPNATPAIFWNSSQQDFMIDEIAGKNYRIWHSGNLSPDVINRTVRRTFIGDGSTTTFDIPEGYTPTNCNVYYNGVRLVETLDYDSTSGTEIVFVIAPEVGDHIHIEAFQSGLLGDNPSS